MTSVLLAEDELALAKSLAQTLEASGMDVRLALNGEIALGHFKRERPDLVLLDVMMPVMDGYETCAEIRKLDRDVPVIFLTALDSDADQIRGLEVGADDYVVKTTSDEVLLARIRKALERMARLRPLKAPESMTRTEATIYGLLKSAANGFVSYDEIRRAVCGEGYTLDEHAIRVHISNMRKKLPAGESVDAKRGFGFRLS